MFKHVVAREWEIEGVGDEEVVGELPAWLVIGGGGFPDCFVPPRRRCHTHTHTHIVRATRPCKAETT